MKGEGSQDSPRPLGEGLGVRAGFDTLHFVPLLNPCLHVTQKRSSLTSMSPRSETTHPRVLPKERSGVSRVLPKERSSACHVIPKERSD